MSSRPIGPDSGLQRLLDEGYQVEVRAQHLLLHNVPYVTSDKAVARATLACSYVENAGMVLPPDNHQVWWTGEFPCFPSGRPIEQLRNEDHGRELFPGFTIRHRFSNKPDGVGNFVDHYTKLLHYLSLIQAQARAIDPNANAAANVDNAAATSEQQAVPEATSFFVYADTASARAEIQSISARLDGQRIAVVGVGGTGAYILDQLSKTPVREIHLFDGDVFLQHNAFRSPGAALQAEFAASPNKADYFKSKYSAMHRGIVSHPYYLDSSNVSELAEFDFVFISIDRGEVRSLLFEQLLSAATPFIDVGLNLQIAHSSGKLLGSCRVTLCTPGHDSHLRNYVPTGRDDEEAIYHENIQIADINALNAQLAIIKWKQYVGFYQDDFDAHNITFSVNSLSLSRDVLRGSNENE